jgi:alpha-1,3-mannosyltransferase
MVTTITREISAQLPDLLNTVAVLVHFLGAERLAFSILEGPSSDATPHILNRVLRPLLKELGVPDKYVRIETDAPRIPWGEVNRIEALADLRNQALKPMLDRSFGDVGPVVFLNDVFLHAADVLELLHQHALSQASITTAWDWMERDPAYFYDVWVARTVSTRPTTLRQIDTGDLFYPIPGSEWHPSDEILASSPASRAAFDALRPFQAFSSWNALAVLDPAPFRPPHKVRFRRGGMGECASSECLLICADFWKAGFGRVQVVPSVQLAYGREVALQTARRLREDTARLGWRGGVPPKDTPVKWRKEYVSPAQS